MNARGNADGKPIKRGRGRPANSGNFRIVPIPRAAPDAKRLGHAFLALALHRTAQNEEADLKETEEARDESA